MFSIPVAMTLLASFVSPMTLLGDPAEIYINGGLYFNSIFSSLFVYPLIVIVFIPVFYGLDITSAYEVRYWKVGLEYTLGVHHKNKCKNKQVCS